MSKNGLPHSSRRPTPARRNPGEPFRVLLLCAALTAGLGDVARADPPAPAPTSAPGGGTAVEPPAVALPATVASAASLRCVIDVYGDSIVAGADLEVRPLTILMRKYPGLTLVDHAVPAMQLTDLAARFEASSRTGRWVVIENGVIDAWRNVQAAVFVQTLQRMIERVRAEGREPVLTGFSRQVVASSLHIHKQQLLRRDQYDLLVHRLAQTMKVPFVDWGAVRFDGARDLTDGVHPGPAYSQRLHDRLGAALSALTGCK